MKEYTYHYGRGTKKFSLDESRVLKEIVMPKQPLLTDVKSAVLDAIEHPIGTPPLSSLAMNEFRLSAGVDRAVTQSSNGFPGNPLCETIP